MNVHHLSRFLLSSVSSRNHVRDCLSCIDEFRADIWFSIRDMYVSRSNLLILVNIYMLSYTTWICVASINLWCSVITFMVDFWLYGKQVNQKEVLPTYRTYFGGMLVVKTLCLPYWHSVPGNQVLNLRKPTCYGKISILDYTFKPFDLTYLYLRLCMSITIVLRLNVHWSH